MRKLLTVFALVIVFTAGLAQSASNAPTHPTVVRSIQFSGLGSLNVEDIVARWNQRNLAFGVERRYDPKQAAQAGEQIRNLFAERNLGNVKVDVTTVPIQPQSLEVIFKVSAK